MARALLLVTLLLGVARPALAAEWGNITPGVTTIEQVRDLYGRPSRETSATVEDYDTRQWIYERSQAPEGLVRLIVDFGLLTPNGYKPSVVRLVTLEPKPLIFGRKTVMDGWGLPDRAGTRDGFETFFYREGLFVVFDNEATKSATTLIFSIPQPDVPPKSAPSASPSAPPPKQ
jgi:hypothetical protein